MPNWPAVSLLDGIIGVDLHAVVGVPIHPYIGLIFLWHTPLFPQCNVLINDLPACSVGAMGYSVHIPQGIPVPPTPTNMTYWQRWKTNILMGIVLMMLTILANMTIALIGTFLPKQKSVDDFIKDVTGIDTRNSDKAWNGIVQQYSQFVKFWTWVKLLMPPIPYPGAQGSSAIGSPSVTVNGGPLSFAGPLLATSCSDLPIVPNANTIGFSNVLVGVSFAALLRAIAVSTAQRAIQTGLTAGVKAATAAPEERQATQTEHT